MVDLAGIAELRFGPLRFALRQSRRPGVFPFENADVRAVLDIQATGGWTLEVIPRAVYLATHPLGEAIALARCISACLGVVRAERLRRLDLAGNYTGFPLNRDILDRLVTTRARRVGFLLEPKDHDEVQTRHSQLKLREYVDQALNVTGVTIAPGNPLMARIYDKSEELRLPGREGKREIEQARWRRGGWDGQEPVTRVEFQHRGAFLDEVELRDPSQIESRIDEIWQQDVRWLRMVVPGTDSRNTRCAVDPRWQSVMNTVFIHQAEPCPRSRRHRGGARPEHVLGSTLSRLGSIGRLQELGLNMTRDGEVLTEASVSKMSKSAALDWMSLASSRLFEAMAFDVVRELALRGDPRTQARKLFVKLEGAMARFSSVDDETR